VKASAGNQETGTAQAKRGGAWGHVLVAACACLLTVAIVGSAAFLTYRIYDRHQWRIRVRSVVASLQNRTPEELSEKAAQVKASPKLARLVLPEVLKSLRDSKSEQQQCSAIRIMQVFVDHKSVEKTLFRLRRDGRESVAAAAINALANVQPPEHAAEVLGRCLDDVKTRMVVDAVVDEACACLYGLGEAGLHEMRKRIPLLTVDRRIWLVGYVRDKGGPHCRAWLEMLQADSEERVRKAAGDALGFAENKSNIPVRGSPGRLARHEDARPGI